MIWRLWQGSLLRNKIAHKQQTINKCGVSTLITDDKWMKTKNFFSKKLLFAAITLLFFGTNCRAQIDGSKQFLYLQSGEVVYSNNISQTQGLFKDYYNVDNRRIELKDIKFINEGKGLYANTKGVLSKNRSMIAECTEKGAINVFELEVISTMRTHSGGSTTTRKIHYFMNKEYNTLQKMTPRNLAPMVQGTNESLMELGKAQSYYNTEMVTSISSATCLVGALGVFFVGLAHYVENDNTLDPNSHFDSKYLIIPCIAIGVGTILAITSNVLDRKKNRSLRKAIAAYNEVNKK